MDATIEVVRNGLKTKLDRRWASCANPQTCPAMASVVPERILSETRHATVGQLHGYQDWLRGELRRFTGPPNMELRVLDEDEFESRADFTAVLMRIPLPDSNGSGDWFPVGRLGYSVAALDRDEGALKHEVSGLLDALVLHESKEWLRRDGTHVVDPHPDN